MALEHRIRWIEREDKDIDPLEFFRENYDSGITRTQLSKSDFSLYRTLSRRGLLDDAIPDFDADVAKRLGEAARNAEHPSKYGDDPVAYYHEHYQGMTRGELHKKDSGLYQRLRRGKLLGEVPRERAESRDFGDPVAYYHEHYQGMTRGELAKEDQGLYQILWRGKLLGEVPVASRFGDDPVAYYHRHYQGMTRWQLAKANHGLYKRLWRDKLLVHVPTKYRLRK